jgi:peroxiredoxin
MTLDGESLVLGGQQDAPVLVVFFAINNPLALTELDHLQTLAEQLGPDTVELVAIALSGERPELVRTIVHGRRYLFPVAMDPDGTAATAFGGITVTPAVFLLSVNGRIEARQDGPTDLRSLSARIQKL